MVKNLLKCNSYDKKYSTKISCIKTHLNMIP